MNKSGHQNSERIESGRIRLRAVCREDLGTLFEFQCEPEAVEMAGFPARDHDAFMTHWDRLLSNPELVTMSVTVDDTVAGHIGSWFQDDQRLVGYWIGRGYWGRGVATQMLSLFLQHVTDRPIRAFVVKHNVASSRVLQKCGFRLDEDTAGESDEFVFVRE